MIEIPHFNGIYMSCTTEAKSSILFLKNDVTVQLHCMVTSSLFLLLLYSLTLGGSNGSEYLSSVECYDPSKMKWVPITDLPTARFGAAAIALSKRDHIHAATVHVS